MGWGTEQTAFAVIGVLFLCGVVASLHPRVYLSLASRIALSSAAGAYAAAAFALPTLESENARSVWWILPLVPVAVILLLVRDLRMAPASVPVNDDTVASSESRVGEAEASDPRTPGAELADLAYTHPDLRVSIASNPSTPSSVLGWLAASGDDAVVDAIAARQRPVADR